MHLNTTIAAGRCQDARHIGAKSRVPLPFNVHSWLGMSRSLLNIEKRSLSWLTLRGVGLAGKNAM
jgi:hypothetical protein